VAHPVTIHAPPQHRKAGPERGKGWIAAGQLNIADAGSFRY
jgi:hypothetical protein